MTSRIQIEGNLLANPSQDKITVNGEDRTICRLRVMNDNWRKDEAGNYQQVDDRTFPVSVTVFNERLAAEAFKHLRKGARVHIDGEIYKLSVYTDETTGKNYPDLSINADAVMPMLTRIEEINYQPPKTKPVQSPEQ